VSESGQKPYQEVSDETYTKSVDNYTGSGDVDGNIFS
jgi:hypothetical protein